MSSAKTCGTVHAWCQLYSLYKRCSTDVDRSLPRLKGRKEFIAEWLHRYNLNFDTGILHCYRWREVNLFEDYVFEETLILTEKISCL